MFLVYAFLGAFAFVIYRQLKSPAEVIVSEPAIGPLGPSRRIIFTLAALFSLDSFGGGFFVQSLLALWLFDHFGLSLIANRLFWSGLLSAFSYPVAVRLARRIGLVNTIVFTHLPSNACLMLVPFAPTLGIAIAWLLIRSALSQMDVPARTSYVMAVVTPPERPAATSITAAPRSLAGAASPVLAGYLLGLSSFGWPLKRIFYPMRPGRSDLRAKNTRGVVREFSDCAHLGEAAGAITSIPVGKEPHWLAVWPQQGRYLLGHTGNMR
jgi:hypothetical protein